MSRIILIVLICFANLFASQAQELKIISWNLKDFGKSRDDAELKLIAKVMNNVDIVCIQEVVAKDPGGAQAVARLDAILDRMGSNWDYRFSNPTNDISPFKEERYAFLWKTKKVKLKDRIKLIDELDNGVCREPSLGSFIINNKELVILNYHACTHTKYYPEREEINLITQWISKKNMDNLIWCGDMNLKITDRAFSEAFRLGFNSALNGEKTSLKRTCKDGNYKSRAEDNILHNTTDFLFLTSEVIDFIGNEKCEEVSWKRNSYSDHLPIMITLSIQ